MREPTRCKIWFKGQTMAHTSLYASRNAKWICNRYNTGPYSQRRSQLHCSLMTTLCLSVGENPLHWSLFSTPYGIIKQLSDNERHRCHSSPKPRRVCQTMSVRRTCSKFSAHFKIIVFLRGLNLPMPSPVTPVMATFTCPMGKQRAGEAETSLVTSDEMLLPGLGSEHSERLHPYLSAIQVSAHIWVDSAHGSGSWEFRQWSRWGGQWIEVTKRNLVRHQGWEDSY